VKFSTENDTNYGTLKSVIEKIPQTGKKCRNLRQTHLIGSRGCRQKLKLKRGSVRTICLSKCPDRTGKGRGVIGIVYNSNHAPPGQAFQFFNSPKSMGFGYA